MRATFQCQCSVEGDAVNAFLDSIMGLLDAFQPSLRLAILLVFLTAALVPFVGLVSACIRDRAERH